MVLRERHQDVLSSISKHISLSNRAKIPIMSSQQPLSTTQTTYIRGATKLPITMASERNETPTPIHDLDESELLAVVENLAQRLDSLAQGLAELRKMAEQLSERFAEMKNLSPQTNQQAQVSQTTPEHTGEAIQSILESQHRRCCRID